MNYVTSAHTPTRATVHTPGGPIPDAEHVKLIGADLLQAQGINGAG